MCLGDCLVNGGGLLPDGFFGVRSSLCVLSVYLNLYIWCFVTLIFWKIEVHMVSDALVFFELWFRQGVCCLETLGSGELELLLGVVISGILLFGDLGGWQCQVGQCRLVCILQLGSYVYQH